MMGGFGGRGEGGVAWRRERQPLIVKWIVVRLYRLMMEETVKLLCVVGQLCVSAFA